jgi:hypothetical protein
MIGRSLRVAKGKTHTVILDHAALINDHPFPDNDLEWSLSGRKSGAAEAKSSEWGQIRRCPECSAVHEWSRKCPECSYVYQIKDRTIEEVYGELREIAQGVEYESQRRFVRRCKLSAHTIAKYVKQKELVTYGPRRLIRIKEGLARVEWLKENEAKYETQPDFAKRVGTNSSVIPSLIKRGLPKAANGGICIEDGLAWLKRKEFLTADSKYIKQNLQSMPGCDSLTSFAKRIGLDGSTATINKLIKKGLPINEFRLIPIEDGLAWLRREGLLAKDGKYTHRRLPSTSGFDTQTRFAKRVGVDPTTVRYLIKKGMPVNDLRLIQVEDGLQWLRREGLLAEDGKYIRQKPRSSPGFDSRSSFAHRIGVDPHAINKLIEKGMPTTGETKLIPVDAALRWVKENCPQHQPNQGTAGENRAVREAAE